MNCVNFFFSCSSIGKSCWARMSVYLSNIFTDAKILFGDWCDFYAKHGAWWYLFFYAMYVLVCVHFLELLVMTFVIIRFYLLFWFNPVVLYYWNVLNLSINLVMEARSIKWSSIKFKNKVELNFRLYMCAKIQFIFFGISGISYMFGTERWYP